MADLSSQDDSKKRHSRRCSKCHIFIEAEDPHKLCLVCRPCSGLAPCSYDQDWNTEQWSEFLKRKAERIAAQIARQGKTKEAKPKAPKVSQSKTTSGKKSKGSGKRDSSSAPGKSTVSVKSTTPGSTDPKLKVSLGDAAPGSPGSHAPPAFSLETIPPDPDATKVIPESEVTPQMQQLRSSVSEEPPLLAPENYIIPGPSEAPENEVVGVPLEPEIVLVSNSGASRVITQQGPGPSGTLPSHAGTPPDLSILSHFLESYLRYSAGQREEEEEEVESGDDGLYDDEEDDDEEEPEDEAYLTASAPVSQAPAIVFMQPSALPPVAPGVPGPVASAIIAQGSAGATGGAGNQTPSDLPLSGLPLGNFPAQPLQYSQPPGSLVLGAQERPLRAYPARPGLPSGASLPRTSIPSANLGAPPRSTTTQPASLPLHGPRVGSFPGTSGTGTPGSAPLGLQGYTIPRVQVAQAWPSQGVAPQGWPLEYFAGSDIQPASGDYVGISTDGKPLFCPPQMRLPEARSAPEAARVLASAGAPAFWEDILINAGLPVDYPPAPEVSSGLGVLERVTPSPSYVVPKIPLAQSTRKAIDDLHQLGKPARFPWLSRVLPCPETDAMHFDTPLCPEACFDKMGEDMFSRCVPLKPTPKGVESSGPPRESRAPFTVRAWNRARDEDLRKLESLARDGLRSSNAQLLVLARLTNSLSPGGIPLSADQLQTSVAFLRDLSHTSIDHFIRIAEQSIISRRHIALEALNLANQSSLLRAPLGADLFGGAWPGAAEAETAHRKRKAEQAKQRAASSANKRSRGQGPPLPRGARSRRGPAQVYPQQQQQWVLQPTPAPLMQVPVQNPPMMGGDRSASRSKREKQGRRGRGGRGGRGSRRGRGRGAGRTAAAQHAPQAHYPAPTQQQYYF